MTIIDGTIYTAGKYTDHEDSCGQKVNVPDKNTNDHPYKGPVDKSDIIDTLKNPFRDIIWEAGNALFYIGQTDGGTWFILKVTRDNPFCALAVSTSWLEGKEFNDGESAEDKLNDEGAKKYDC